VTLYQLETRVQLPRPRAEVFQFFADAANLQVLTPDWLSFDIMTPLPFEMRQGALIDYRLRLHGIPVRWKTQITIWEPPYRFVDEQLKGPYRQWVHEHTFEGVDGTSTLVGDRVRYAVPFGALANWLLVERDVRKIFAFRHRKLGEIFGGQEGAAEVRVERVRG